LEHCIQYFALLNVDDTVPHRAQGLSFLEAIFFPLLNVLIIYMKEMVKYKKKGAEAPF
jgi:hypothetical protein